MVPIWRHISVDHHITILFCICVHSYVKVHPFSLLFVHPTTQQDVTIVINKQITFIRTSDVINIYDIFTTVHNPVIHKYYQFKSVQVCRCILQCNSLCSQNEIESLWLNFIQQGVFFHSHKYVNPNGHLVQNIISHCGLKLFILNLLWFL